MTPDYMCDFAIIINSFNRLTLLKECLASLSTWLPSSIFSNNYRVVIYDAGSNDGSFEWLKREEGIRENRYEVIGPAAGGGNSFACGLNAGVSHILNIYPQVKYLMFYETDNLITNQQPVLQAIQVLETIRDVAACGFTVCRRDGTSAGVGQPFPKLLNFAFGRQLVQKFQLEKIHYRWRRYLQGFDFSYVDVVYTSPLVVRADAWKKSGGLDAKRFPFSDCDVDWAKRLRSAGWRMGVVKTTSVFHDNREMTSGWSKKRALQFHYGRLQYFRIYHAATVFAVWPFVLCSRHIIEMMAATLFVKSRSRRKQLMKQFANLISSCFFRYNR